MGDYGKSIGAHICGLTLNDLAQLKKGTLRVLKFMSDGLWHNAAAIREAAGDCHMPASEGLRRMRELRPKGIYVDKRRIGKSRLWDYRLVWDKAAAAEIPVPTGEFFAFMFDEFQNDTKGAEE